MTESAPIARKGLALALLAAAQFIVVLDASIVNVALPSMGRDLDFATEDLSWVVNAYTLVFGGFLLLGGRLADLFGRRRLFMGGLVLFSLAYRAYRREHPRAARTLTLLGLAAISVGGALGGHLSYAQGAGMFRWQPLRAVTPRTPIEYQRAV